MAQSELAGALAKMKTDLDEGLVQYHLPVGDELLPMNALLGKRLSLRYDGKIHCVHCGRLSKKSFNQGYCYPCFQKLAQCDSCIVSPEKCHYFQGTCREPEWGEQHCMIEHVVYLANSSGLKVGITRGTQVPTRWIDQGAVSALPIFRVANRLQSGLVETLYKNHVADKTSWQAMLKGEPAPVDLTVRAAELAAECRAELGQLADEHGLQAIQPVHDVAPLDIRYPVAEYPVKVTSFNLDKSPLVEGSLMGIKGQYLMLDTGVINMRKFAGYHVVVSES